MKKISLLLGIAFGFGLAACNEFDLPNPPGQSNPEEPEFKSENLEIKQAAQTLDLKADNEADEKVTLAEITKLVDFPASYELAFEVELSQTADFANTVTLATEVTDNLIQVEPADFNNAIYNNFTKDPADIDIYARIAAYAERGDTKIRLGGTGDFWYGNDYEYLVIPYAPAKYLDTQYYLLQRAIGATTWDVTAALPFTHTTDASVYDNPEFKIAFTVGEEGTEWAVLPGASFDAANLDGIMGVEDATAAEGTLVDGVEDMVYGKITEPSPYTIRIDVEAMTYQVTFAFDVLYVPGTATSMGFRSALQLTTSDYMNYSGVARLRQQWWLTSTQSLQKGTIFYQAPGEDAAHESIDARGIITYSGSLTTDAETGLPLTVGNDPDGKRIDGLFYIDANVTLLTYKAIWMSEIGMVGEFNGWNTEEPILLTHDSKYTTWTAKNVELKAGGFKFCIGNWAVSWGGSLDNLEQGGMDNNLTIPEDGKYDVKLDFTAHPYTATLTKK